jgi:hypothetical protein
MLVHVLDTWTIGILQCCLLKRSVVASSIVASNLESVCAIPVHFTVHNMLVNYTHIHGICAIYRVTHNTLATSLPPSLLLLLLLRLLLLLPVPLLLPLLALLHCHHCSCLLAPCRVCFDEPGNYFDVELIGWWPAPWPCRAATPQASPQDHRRGGPPHAEPRPGSLWCGPPPVDCRSVLCSSLLCTC